MINFHENTSNGIFVFSAGPSWKHAFDGAQKYLHEFNSLEKSSKNILLFGPSVDKQSLVFFQEYFESHETIRVHEQILSWRKWVQKAAEGIFDQNGISIQEIHPLEKREFLFEIFAFLDKKKMLTVLSEVWQEEGIFSSILNLVEELRQAGFSDTPTLLALQDFIEKKEFVWESTALKDVWLVLQCWHEMQKIEVDESTNSFAKKKDYSDLLKEIKNNINQCDLPDSIYMIGFEHLSVMELEFLRELSQKIKIFLPLSLKEPEIDFILSNRIPEGNLQRSAAESLAFLVGGSLNKIVNRISLEEEVKDVEINNENGLPIYLAINPSEEIYSVIHFIELLFSQSHIEEAQIIVPNQFFKSSYLPALFAKRFEKFSVSGLSEEKVINSRVYKQVRQAIKMIIGEFQREDCIEYAELVCNLTQRNYLPELRKIIHEKNIGNGIEAWGCFSLFHEDLITISNIFPKTGNGKKYRLALKDFFKFLNYADLAKEKKEDESQIHSHLSIILQIADEVAQYTQREFSLKEWIAEVDSALEDSQGSNELHAKAKIKFYSYGKWIPPISSQKSLRLYLSLNSEIDPSVNSSFLMSERDRLILKDLGVQYQLAKENDFLNWFKFSANTFGKVICSAFKMSHLGKEIESSLLASIFNLEEMRWPTVLLNPYNGSKSIGKPSLNKNEFKIELERLEHYSASLLDRWLDCGFLSLVERIWKSSDNLINASLDPNPLDEGNIIHKVLEKFFIHYQDKNFSHDNWEKTLLGIFEKIFPLHPYQNYSGGDFLVSYSRMKILSKLKSFIENEISYLREYPKIKKIICEQSFSWNIDNKHKIIGKIDRIDIDPDLKNFLIIDYKTGNGTPSSQDVISLQKFQLPIYIHSQKYLGNAVGAYYLSVTDHSRNQGIVQKQYNRTAKNTEINYFQYSARTLALREENDFIHVLDQAKEKIINTIAEIDSGSFPISPADAGLCERCRVRPACRIREEKNLNNGTDSISDHKFLSIFLENKKSAEAITNGSSKLIFSSEQEEALQTENKMIFLEASAGSGKTTILVEKFIRAMRSIELKLKLSPMEAASTILAVSFTEKSAAEIKHRLLNRLTEEYGYSVALQATRNISTIHGLNRKIIAQFANLVGINPCFEILNETEAKRKKENAIFNLFVKPSEETKQVLEELFALFTRKDLERLLLDLLEKRSLLECNLMGKNFVVDPVLKKSWEELQSLFQFFCKEYDQEKNHILDFNDLERLSWKILQNPSVRAMYRKKYSLIMVDEFQDTNVIQREIIEAISKENRKNTFVVGDAKQSIYRFRSANVSVFQTLRQQAATEKSLFLLNKNFRSETKIVDFSNALTNKLFPDKWTDENSFEAQASHVVAAKTTEGNVIALEYKLDENIAVKKENIRKNEAKLLAQLIQEKSKKGIPYNSIAVIFRKLSGNEIYLKVLEEAGIPYRLSNRGNFYQNQIVLDGISLLRSLQDPENKLSLLSILRSPWCSFDQNSIHTIMQKDLQAMNSFISNDLAMQWFCSLRNNFCSQNLSKILFKAYELHPLFSLKNTRIQMEKLVSIVEDLETKIDSKREVIRTLSSLAGWEKEQDAMPEPLVSDIDSDGAVQILTAHAAKGLQFPVVILCDLDSAGKIDSPILRIEPNIGVAFKVRDNNEFIANDFYKQISEEQIKREYAESKRLFYVAITRAMNQLFLLLPDIKTKEGKAATTWGGWVREMKGDDSIQFLAEQEYFQHSCEAIQNMKSKNNKPDSKINYLPKSNAISEFGYSKNNIVKVSTTELAAFQFCAEFYRLKYVQKWQDSVVALWKESSQESKAKEDQYFLNLGISKQNRGIAIHRLLEKINKENFETFAEQFLKNYYHAMGINITNPLVYKLIHEDLQFVRMFLESNLGEKIFSSHKNSYAELNFSLKINGISINGAMDRVVELSDGTWVVVDYKTGKNISNNYRYKVQVETYLLAMEEYLRSHEIQFRKLEGWIIDIFTGNCLKIDVPDKSNWLKNEIVRLKEDNFKASGTEACENCVFLSHCTIGQQYMLSYS